MKRLYTGPFSSVLRHVWVERAREMSAEEWVWLLPTRHLLHTVRGQLLEGQAGLIDVPLLTFDDVAKALVQHTERPIQSLNLYAREKLIESLVASDAEDDRLAVFRPIMDQPGLYRSVAQAIGEMKRSGLTVTDARNYLEQREHFSMSEQRQVALAYLFVRYQEALYQDERYLRLDPEEYLSVACDVLEQNDLPPAVPFSQIHTLWVDHFTDFTPLQLRLLCALIQRATAVGIYMPFPHERAGQLPQLSTQLHDTRQTLARLAVKYVDLNGMSAASALKQLQKDWLHHKENPQAQWSSADVTAGKGTTDLSSAGLATIHDSATRPFSPKGQGVLGRKAKGAGEGASVSVEDSEQVSVSDSPGTPIRTPVADHLLQKEHTRSESGDARPPAPPGLACLPACTPEREVEAVAKEIKRLVRLEGIPLHEIAVIVRDAAYEPLLHEVFARDGIPLHAHEQRGLHEMALSRQLLALLDLAGTNWERRDVLCLAEGGYMEWQHWPPHGMETWAKKAGIDEGKKKWLDTCAQDIARLQLQERELVSGVADETERERRTAQFSRLKQKRERWLAWFKEVERLIDVLTAARSWQERIDRIEQICQRLNVERRIKRLWIEAIKKGEIEGYRRDLDVWHALKDALREMKQLEPFMSEKVRQSWGGFVQELRRITAQKHVIVRRGQEGGVRLFDPSAVRGSSFAAVFVLGLNEGNFPSHHAEDWLIRDAERVSLYGGRARLPASYAQNEMEQLFFEMAIHSARHYLILSYISPAADEEVLRSRFLEQLEERYMPGSWLAPERFQEAMESRFFPRRMEDITSPREYRHWVMAQAQAPSSNPWDALYREQEQKIMALRQHADIERERREGAYGRWDGHLRDPRIHDQLRQEFSPERTYSVSWINDYAACPLHFFFARVLRVQPLEEAESAMTPLDIGNVCHEVLRQLLALHSGRHMCERTLNEWRADLAAVFSEVVREWETEWARLLSPFWSLEKDRLMRLLERWLEHEYERQGRRRFKPQYLEFSFGLPLSERVDDSSTEQAIALPLQNETLLLVGRIDRVDQDDAGNFVLYDYKLSTHRYSDCHKMAQTTNFQLPLYILAYRQWLKEQGKEGRAIGAGFYGLRSQENYRKVGVWEKNALEDLGLGRIRTGVTDDVAKKAEEVLPRVADMLSAIRDGHFYLLPEHEPNVFYADQAVYRHDPITLQQKSERVSNDA